MKMEEKNNAMLKVSWYRKGWVILGLFLLCVVGLGLFLFINRSIEHYKELKSGVSQSEFMPIGAPTAEMKMEQLLQEKNRDQRKELVKAQASDPFFGPKDAEHEIVFFEDFGCPFCKMSQSLILALIQSSSDIKIVLRDFPITELHPNSLNASRAARCVWRQGDQNKYLRYRDLLFSRQEQHDISSLFSMASEVGAESLAFKICMEQKSATTMINQSIMDAESAGVTATPTFFVDGIKVEGVRDYSTVMQMIK